MTAGTSLRRLCARVVVGVGLAAACLVAAATYDMAMFRRVDSTLDQTPAVAGAKARSLDEARSALGNGGLLNALVVYTETGSPQARTDIGAALDGADKAVRAFEAYPLSAPESELAKDLHRLIDRYRAGLAASGDKPQFLTSGVGLSLMTLHASVADRVAQLRRQETLLTAQALAGPARSGFWLGIGAVGLMLVVVALLLWIVRLRLLVPLDALRESVAAVARGDWRSPVAGTSRGDELGEMARAIDAFRRQAAELPDIAVISEDGRTHLKFAGSAADLFESLTQRLRQAGETLESNGGAVAGLVDETRGDLADTVAQVRDLCAAVAKTASDSNRELREATGLLGRAAVQVRAFDEQDGGDGLDALIASLRRNAELVANTVLTAGEDVGRVVRGLSETEGDLRRVAGDAQDTNARMGEAMGDLQNKLMASVRLLRASGEMLANGASEATAGLTRATEAVNASDRALQTTLAFAGDRMERASGRMDTTAETLRIAAQDMSQGLSGALEALGRANRLIESAAEANSSRLEPVAESLAAVQRDLAGAATGVALRAGEMARTLEALNKLSLTMHQELDRRSADPDQKAQTQATLNKLEDVARALGEQAGAVNGTAEHLAGMLHQTLDQAGQQVAQSVKDLQREAAVMANDAASASNALSRALARQDEATEGLKALTADLRPLLRPQIDPNVDALRDLVDTLRARLETVDSTAHGLLSLTQSLQDVVESGRASERASNAATKDLGERLAAIAEQLRAATGAP